MRKTVFFVGERPCAVWGTDIHKRNMTFLTNFDTKYFEYLADIHFSQIGSDVAQQAATALRTSYGLGLETFFSLLGAAIQAPDCVFGWLFKYKDSDLALVINCIMGKERLQTRLFGHLSWESLSNLVNRNLVLDDKEKENEIKARYAKLWEYLAMNYLDNDLRNEFNSVKHGLRLQPGGIQVAIGQQDRPDMPAPPERMQSIPGSKFGATVLRLERIGGLKHDYHIKEDSRNWDISSLTGRIRMISMSIGNVISFLLIQNGQDPTHSRFFWPEDLEDFDKVWEPSFVLTRVIWGVRIDEKDIKPTQTEDVEKVYPKQNAGSRKD